MANKATKKIIKELLEVQAACRKKPGPKCSICSHKQVANDVKTVLELIASGEIEPITVVAVWHWLKSNYSDFDEPVSTLRVHIRNHERTLYLQCKERSKKWPKT